MNGFQIKVIEKAIENDYKLTSWEIDFINDLANKPEDYLLSEKQNEILNKIQQKVY